jgi:hypothetical protein
LNAERYVGFSSIIRLIAPIFCVLCGVSISRDMLLPAMTSKASPVTSSSLSLLRIF